MDKPRDSLGIKVVDKILNSQVRALSGMKIILDLGQTRVM